MGRERGGKKDGKRKEWQQRRRKLSSRENETAWRMPSNERLLATPSTHSTFSPIYLSYATENTHFLQMNTHVSLMSPIIALAKPSTGESHWDLFGNYTSELIHPQVFMTGHFKWPLASLLLMCFLHPLILFFPGLCLVMSFVIVVILHARHPSPS